MDFRDPETIGTFLYLLEHKDGGMMGLIRMESSGPGPNTPVGPSK
jgi:hypothetical protein